MFRSCNPHFITVSPCIYNHDKNKGSASEWRLDDECPRFQLALAARLAHADYSSAGAPEPFAFTFPSLTNSSPSQIQQRQCLLSCVGPQVGQNHSTSLLLAT